jgi:hypothetical protein
VRSLPDGCRRAVVALASAHVRRDDCGCSAGLCLGVVIGSVRRRLTDASANRLPGQHFADDEHHYFLGGGQRLPSGGRQVRERPGRAYPAKEPCVGPRGPVRRVFLRCGENYYQHRRPAPAARCWQCRWRNFAAAAEALTSSESVSTPSKRPREASPPSKQRRHVPRRTQRATLDEIAPA